MRGCTHASPPARRPGKRYNARWRRIVELARRVQRHGSPGGRPFRRVGEPRIEPKLPPSPVLRGEGGEGAPRRRRVGVQQRVPPASPPLTVPRVRGEGPERASLITSRRGLECVVCRAPRRAHPVRNPLEIVDADAQGANSPVASPNWRQRVLRLRPAGSRLAGACPRFAHVPTYNLRAVTSARSRRARWERASAARWRPPARWRSGCPSSGRPARPPRPCAPCRTARRSASRRRSSGG